MSIQNEVLTDTQGWLGEDLHTHTVCKPRDEAAPVHMLSFIYDIHIPDSGGRKKRKKKKHCSLFRSQTIVLHDSSPIRESHLKYIKTPSLRYKVIWKVIEQPSTFQLPCTIGGGLENSHSPWSFPPICPLLQRCPVQLDQTTSLVYVEEMLLYPHKQSPFPSWMLLGDNSLIDHLTGVILKASQEMLQIG